MVSFAAVVIVVSDAAAVVLLIEPIKVFKFYRP